MAKKILTILIACFAFAAFAQLTDYTKKDDSGVALWNYNDGVFTFNSTYVWTDFAARIDYKKSGSASRSDMKLEDLVEFGYYKINGSGEAGAAQVMFQRNEAGEMVTKNSVILNGGDKIGIYAKIQTSTDGHYEQVEYGHYNKKGKWIVDGYNWKYVDGETTTKTYTTTANAIEGAEKVVNNVDHDSVGKDTQYFCLFIDRFNLQDHFEYYLAHIVTGDNYNEFISDVIDQNTDPNGNPITVITDGDGNPVKTSGQPLPGLMVSLAIGAAAVGGLKRKKH